MATISSRLRVGVVGVGHLGQSHARILAGLPDVELVGVVDVNRPQAEAVAKRCGTTAFPDFPSMIGAVDAVSVVVPTVHHHAVASAFLAAGVPTLVEKPLAPTLAEADDLVRLARKTGAILQVGHIERFNSAFEELQRRPIQPKFVECERHGPFTGRSTDIGAVLDLMIHDLDLLLALVGGPVVEVDAMGVCVFGGHEDVVNARLRFAGGCIAHVTASRVSPGPKRRLRIWAPEGYAGIDFVQRRLSLVQPTDELRRDGLKTDHLSASERATLQTEIFGKHLEFLELTCNAGDQLTRELQDFVTAVRTGGRPRVTGEDGRAAIGLAERVLESVRRHPWTGKPKGPCGPANMPPPLGKLFPPEERFRGAA